MPSPARPRHVAFSHKQKKLQMQMRRAMKRGEYVEGYEKTNGRIRLDRSHAARSEAHDDLDLHSRFLRIPRDYAETTRNAAWSDELLRPIPDSYAAFPVDIVDNPAGAQLSVPARPPFLPDQTKREVEENEEEMFRKWLRRARQTVEDWVDGADVVSDDNEGDESPETSNDGAVRSFRSPSSFEINLEVWRQLWRVVEASSILLLLVDARCPPVHCPPSLRAYLRSLRPRREIILVLTKTDLVDPEALAGWREWLKNWWMCGPPIAVGEVDHEPQVVTVSSYDTSLLYGEGRLRPYIPSNSRAQLLEALQIAHARLLSPPMDVATDSEKLSAWQPSVRESVHWTDLEGDAVVVKDDDERHRTAEPSASHTRDTQPDPPLTFGLIGQPNVGKSSLLNALLGATRVSAGRTPGKTKHWQTLLWGPRREVRIVDCPGLVCPSLVPMEMQAMSGILSIAQIPSLPACIHFAAKFIPLEQIYRIPAPPVVVDAMESKRTWRGPRPAIIEETKPRGPRWTTGEIIDGRATDRGFKTAKSARPDANRASDGILRDLAEGNIRWGFWPPGTKPAREGRGLWLGEWDGLDSGDGSDSELEARISQLRIAQLTDGKEDNEEEDDVESEEETEYDKANKAGFFAALSPDEGDDDDDDDDVDD